jgi:hypothetical protein
VPGISAPNETFGGHVLNANERKDVDGRDKPGHDEAKTFVDKLR